jgi:hypothetical protein
MMIFKYMVGVKPPLERHINIILWRLKIHYSHRSPASWMGRFGGGWNWALGIRVGGRCVLLQLLILEISFNWLTAEERQKWIDKQIAAA